MNEKTKAKIGICVNLTAAALWAVDCATATSMTVRVIAVVCCVIHGFFAGILTMGWLDS